MAGTIASFSALNANAVMNAAGTSYALLNETNTGPGCNTAKSCIFLSPGGTVDDQSHGDFVFNPTVDCAAYNAASLYPLSAPMTTPTLISTLLSSFVSNTASTLCASGTYWHIFRTTSTTPATIWAVKLTGSTNPTTLDSTNFKECQSTWNFDTTNGCAAPASPPVSASINLMSNEKPVIFAEEVEMK